MKPAAKISTMAVLTALTVGACGIAVHHSRIVAEATASTAADKLADRAADRAVAAARGTLAVHTKALDEASTLDVSRDRLTVEMDEFGLVLAGLGGDPVRRTWAALDVQAAHALAPVRVRLAQQRAAGIAETVTVAKAAVVAASAVGVDPAPVTASLPAWQLPTLTEATTFDGGKLQTATGELQAATQAEKDRRAEAQRQAAQQQDQNSSSVADAAPNTGGDVLQQAIDRVGTGGLSVVVTPSTPCGSGSILGCWTNGDRGTLYITPRAISRGVCVVARTITHESRHAQQFAEGLWDLTGGVLRNRAAMEADADAHMHC